MTQSILPNDTLERLHDDMARANLAPTWKYVKDFVSAAPKVSYRPFLWKWDHVYEYVARSGDLIAPGPDAERRSMEHVNPDLKPYYATSHTLATAVQLVKAGESAPAHRHQAAAIRFAARSAGGDVFTRVQGEPLIMEENDLLLTPAGTWHEHENNTDRPIVWLDALDFPLINLLQCSFFEPGHGAAVSPARPAGYTNLRMGSIRPMGWGAYPDDPPVMRYAWKDTYATLQTLREEHGSPYDGVVVEYVNPLTSGPTLPTMSCRAHLLRPGERGLARRSSSSCVYYVVSGTGQTIIEGQRFDWARGDVFVVPIWAWSEHCNPGKEDCYLFSITDRPVMETLRLYREEPFAENDGHQTVTHTFVPKAD